MHVNPEIQKNKKIKKFVTAHFGMLQISNSSLTAHPQIVTSNLITDGKVLYHTKFHYILLMEINNSEIYIGDKDDVPVEILSLLPKSEVSILGLLQHPLPLVTHGFAPSSTSSFFNNNPPNVTDNDSDVIFTIPIPPAMSVITLDKAFPEAVENGYQSIRCLHIALTVGKTYPLWIIPLWKIVSHIHIV